MLMLNQIEEPIERYIVTIGNDAGCQAEKIYTNNWNKVLRKLRQQYGKGWIVCVYDRFANDFYDKLIKTNRISK